MLQENSQIQPLIKLTSSDYELSIYSQVIGMFPSLSQITSLCSVRLKMAKIK